MNKTFGLALTSLALAGTADARIIRDPRPPATGGGAHTLSVDPVFELRLTLHAGQRITCRTENLSPGADPVLHLLSFSPFGGAAVEKARDDDSGGGLNARLTFRSLFPRKVVLLMRAAGENARGTADLVCDDRPVAFKLPVGGAFKRLESIRNRETLLTVPLPGAPLEHVMYVLGDDGALLERHVSGLNESVARTLASRSTENLMVADLWPNITGPVRLVRNDHRLAGHDPDEDGLGAELEKQVGTCSTLAEIAGDWECSRSMDARDTDGDGLRDDLELLGLFTPSEPFQLLPRWGADPRHKDLFIEVDSMARSHIDPPHILGAAAAKEMAAIYADAETNTLLRILHAQLLGNPDRQPGIRLHFDSGVRPSAGAPPEEHALYGDWGGHTVVPPICDGDNCRGADGPTVWRGHMHPHRFGIFHYALGDAATGGQAPFHSIALNMPVASPVTAAHELGHTLGLDHSGPQADAPNVNCKPNYPSLMSYAYQGASGAAVPNTFSDGLGRAALNNVALRERGAVGSPGSLASARYLKDLEEVYGYNVVTGTGDVDWNRDGVFSDGPVRAYANDNGQCELTRIHAMPSAGRTDGAPALTRLGDRTIIVYADERDRRIHFDFTTGALDCPSLSGGGCGPPLTRRAVDEPWNRSIAALDAHPVAVDGERRLLVVFRRQGRGRLLETTLSADLEWTTPQPIPSLQGAVDEFSLAGSDDRTILAFKNRDGRVVIKVRSSSGAWSGDEIARDLSGAEIGNLPGGTSPGIVEATHADGTRVIYGVFAISPRAAFRLYRQDPATGRWQANPFGFPEDGVLGRPALSFEPVNPGSPLPGRLRILYPVRSDDGGKKSIRQLTLQADLDPVESRLVPTLHDNSDFQGVGVDLLFEPGVDSNLRAVVATALVKEGVEQPHEIQFRPLADGLVDFEQKNADDWETLGVSLCRTLFTGGARVRCPGLPGR